MNIDDARAFLFGDGLPCPTCNGNGVLEHDGETIPRAGKRLCPDCGNQRDAQGSTPGKIRASLESRALASLIRATGRLNPPPDAAHSALHLAATLANDVLAADVADPLVRDSARRLLNEIKGLRDHGYF